MNLNVSRLVGIAGLLGVLALSTPVHAGDGKPFLMKVGTGQIIIPIAAFTGPLDMMSVSITPKKDGLCTVTASFTAQVTDGPLVVSLSTTSNFGGPWVQVYGQLNQYVSGAMTQAFVVAKNVPVTFYMNGSNNGSFGTVIENTRIWVICEQEKVPVLP